MPLFNGAGWSGECGYSGACDPLSLPCIFVPAFWCGPASLAVAPHVLDSEFNVDAPEQVGMGVSTHISAVEGWMFPSMGIDLFSHRVVCWFSGQTCSISWANLLWIVAMSREVNS
jgi:hypothetical protein